MHQEVIPVIGFWADLPKAILPGMIENLYHRGVIRDMMVSDVVVSGGKILIKWDRRHRPLTDQEIKEKYGK